MLGTSALVSWIRHRPWIADGLFAAALGAVLLPKTATAIRASAWSVQLETLAIVAVSIAHGCVAFRRLAPRSAYGVVCGVMVLLVALPDLEVPGLDAAFAPVLLPSVVSFPVVLYSVAAWCSHRTSLLALAAAGVGTLLVVARLWGADYLTVARPGDGVRDDPVRSMPLFVLLGVVTAVILPWALGRYRRLQTQYVIELEERARREEQDRVESARLAAREERARVAREMHDVVSHSLSVMVSQAEGGRMMAKRDPEVTVSVLENVARTGQEAMRDMRGLLHAMNPDEPDQVRTPQPGLDDLPDLIARVRGAGLPVALHEFGERSWISGAGELAAYRVSQESLTNVLKHGEPNSGSEVRLSWEPGRLQLTIRSHPVRHSTVPVRRGRGLTGMRERVEVLGGTLTAGPADDGSFTVSASIPTLASIEEWSR